MRLFVSLAALFCRTVRIVYISLIALLCLIAIPGRAQGPAATFAAAVDLGGAGGTSVAFGDLNLDGKLDLVAATGTAVNVYLGNGDGTFQAPLIVPGTYPTSVALGDVNGDGVLDIVTGNSANNDGESVSVFLGNGDGTFQTAISYSFGQGIYGVAMGDFNGDGNLDIVAAVPSSNSIGVLMGNGDGTFGNFQSYSSPYPYAVAVGDFNGDGKPDVVTTNLGSSNNVSVFMNNGNGTFAPGANYSVGSEPYGVAVGDFNGDGKPDLVTVNYAGNNVSVLMNNGNGTFAAATNYSLAANSYPYGVAVGDFNGDGKPDLVIANSDTASVSVLLNNGNGTFAPAVNYGTLSTTAVAVGDFDGDGKLDVVAGSYEAVSVLRGNGDGTLVGEVYNAGVYVQSVAAGDFNNDGKPDLVTANPLNNNVSVLLNNGNGKFAAPVNYSTGSYPWDVAVADFNGDGKPDVVTANLSSNNVSVLLNNGNGTFSAAANYSVGSEPYGVAVGDFNGDGKPGVVTANYADINVSVLLNNGNGTFAPAANYSVGSYPYAVAVGDLNGDGKPDLVTINYGGSVSVLLGNGDGTFQTAVNYSLQGITSYYNSIAIADFNRDGNLDVTVTTSLGVYVLLGNGDGTLRAAALYGAGSFNGWVAAADFNGDGNIDLAAFSGLATGVLQGNGDGTFQTAGLSYGMYAQGAAVADYNGDGKPDLALATYSGVQVMLNTTPFDSPPLIVSPPAYSKLTGSTTTFQWQSNDFATAYWLDVGSSAGADDYYQSGSLPTTTFSATVTGLPTNGTVVYATLYGLIEGHWFSKTFSYIASDTLGNKAALTSPVAGSAFAGTSATFQWTAGTGDTGYWIDIGNARGANTYYQSGALPSSTLSQTVNSLPSNGSTVYVTLYSLWNNQWLPSYYTYQSFNISTTEGVLNTPTPGSTLSGSGVTFQWTAGSGATAYWMDIGSSAGANNYEQSGLLSASTLALTVNTLPENGSAVYVTLYSLVNGSWVAGNYVYTAFNLQSEAGAMTTPISGSTLSGPNVLFHWAKGSGATNYWLDIGASAGGHDYWQSGSLPGSTASQSVTGLPTNGSAVYATLYSLVNGSWLYNSYTYSAVHYVPASIVSPAPGSTLSGGEAIFTWNSTPGAAAYWVDVGSSPGGNNIYQSGNLGLATTLPVAGLPSNGSTIYVTLYTLLDGSWQSTSVTYTAGP